MKRLSIMQQDQFERLLPTFIQIIDLSEQEESEYWSILSDVFEGKEIDSTKPRPSSGSVSSSSMEVGINNKVGISLLLVLLIRSLCA